MTAKPAIITVNGQRQEINLPCSVADFVASCGFKTTQTVVELNGKVLPRDSMAAVKLQNGDRVELVIPVAGG